MISIFDLICPYRSTCWLGKSQRYWTRKRRIKHARRMRKAAKLDRRIAVAVVDAFQQKFPAAALMFSALQPPMEW